MRTLIVTTLFLFISAIESLAVGTTILSESGDSGIYYPGGANNGCLNNWTSDFYYWKNDGATYISNPNGIYANGHSAISGASATHVVSLTGYDDARISFYYSGIGGACTGGASKYFNGTWNTICSLSMGTQWTYMGPYTIPVSATQIQFSLIPTGSYSSSYTGYFDDILIMANNKPSLTYTAETGYTADAIEPNTGGTSDNYVFRVKYTDTDNDAPAAGYPRVIISSNGVGINTLVMNYVSGSYSSGAIYSISTTLQRGTNYTYRFETTDGWLSANNLSGSGPNVHNIPSLVWTGETNYTDKGVYSIYGSTDTLFTFRINYMDTENNAPAAGYPRVCLSSAGVVVNTIILAYVSGTYSSGAIYSTSMLLSPCTSYEYKFQANNGYAASDDLTGSGPRVYIFPTLSWTGESNYIDDGINPEITPAGSTSTFRVRYNTIYSAIGSTAPTLSIFQNSLLIYSSTMLWDTTVPIVNGKVFYSYAPYLSVGDYQYSFAFSFPDPAPYSVPNSLKSFTICSPSSNIAQFLPISASTGIVPDFSIAYPTRPIFEIVYIDSNGFSSAIGYPKLHLRFLDYTTEYVMNNVSDNKYDYLISFIPSTGTWTYWYTYKNDFQPSEYASYAGEMIITSPIPSTVIPQLPIKGSENLPAYFVVKYPDKPKFEIAYIDSQGYSPADGYPKLYLEFGSSIAEYTMTKNSNNNYEYQMAAAPSMGTWTYWYTFRNDYHFIEYSTSISSFVVTKEPENFQITGVANNDFTTTGRVRISWNATDPENIVSDVRESISSNLTYKLYFGEDSFNMPLIYEGTDNYFDVTGLKPSKTYYWQVATANRYGVSIISQINTFSTIPIPEKAFLYPNPFQAGRESTNIVFSMPENGSAALTIYSEFGEKIFDIWLDNLVSGSNSYSYDGKDINGKTLFSGTYVCIINKKYSGKESVDKCRLLIIK